MVEWSRSNLVSAALLLVLAGSYTFADLSDYGRVAPIGWWNVALSVVLAMLYVGKYTSPTVRRWLDDPAVLGGVAALAVALAAVLFSVHGPTPAWMVALVGIVAALAALGEWMGPKPLRATRWAQVAALAVAVGFVAFGASFLAGSLDRSSVASATLSAAAGMVVAWLALRWRRSVAWAK